MQGWRYCTCPQRRRNVLRSMNNPTGDYTEWLVSRAMGLTLETNSEKGFDATDGQGIRYQIKGRRINSKNASTQLGVMRNYEEKSFDFLVAVIFGANWNVIRAAQINHETVGQLATFRQHQNGHVMHLRENVFETSGVEDIKHLLNNYMQEYSFK